VLNLGVQNFSDLVQGSNSELYGGGRKMSVFQRKTGHISETVRDKMVKVTIDH